MWTWFWREVFNQASTWQTWYLSNFLHHQIIRPKFLHRKCVICKIVRLLLNSVNALSINNFGILWWEISYIDSTNSTVLCQLWESGGRQIFACKCVWWANTIFLKVRSSSRLSARQNTLSPLFPHGAHSPTHKHVQCVLLMNGVFWTYDFLTR